MDYMSNFCGSKINQFPDVPSVWECAIGDIFICFSGFSSAKQPPSAWYHELEQESQTTNQEFAGGLQACVIVRYYKSPIGRSIYLRLFPFTDHGEGMYDELLWIPGAFKLPQSGKRTYRSTRAYVSTPLAVYSGRKNWNVPKASAVFEFIPTESTHFPYSRITVSPDLGGEPFIDLNFQEMAFGSRALFPFNSRYIPFGLDFDFPPLPGDQNGQTEGKVGTSEWQRVHLDVAGKAGIVKASGKLGDDISFPHLRERSRWVWLQRAKIRIEGSLVP
ncbi:hypothetical protein BDQ94DRAFT_185695 [Aspergillus welwitschiae]|uniref:Acetoacetate decarboxylase n=1 Tax=Aspergillus welwitschiae TaxID=1341132 RepID=A0A3F3PIY6_9EURO|nr:hypothetical protein BDQ94DRAFT_185695 [Aspergillus welwitschiae]RDH26889.1 hypothetical protein BDQ94DRAFT_185695 [Aspergillus welwitschiae]